MKKELETRDKPNKIALFYVRGTHYTHSFSGTIYLLHSP